MEALLSLSKEERIARRRTRIREKLNAPNALATIETSTKTIVNNNEKESEDANVESFSNDTIKYGIIKKFEEKKEDLINNLSSEINKETKPFLEYIKQFENNEERFLQITDEYDGQQIEEGITELNKFDSKNAFVEIKNLTLKEKEAYSKKIEKYFALLQYRDERIQEVCQIHSTNFVSLINLMKDQMEGYKIYLEGIYNKKRDELIMKRKNLLNANKKILEDYLKLQDLNLHHVAIDIMEDEDQLNEKIRKQHEENFSKIELKTELLKTKLNTNIDFVKNISRIVIDKEKNIYDGKILMQKNNYHLKMLNFYKLEINKLREALLAVKTYYYNYKIKSKKVVNELITQYERIKFQFIELQKRQKNYDHNFQNKYAAAWELQKSEVKQYVEKLIAANKIIHEQIFLIKHPDNDYSHLLEENISVNVDTTNDEKQKKTPAVTRKVTKEQIEHVKEKLLQECAFLIDDNDLHETDEEKLNKILKYIGVNNQKDLELLTQLFYIEEKEKKEEEGEEAEEEEEKEEDKEETDKDEEEEEEEQDVEENIEKKEKKNLCIASEYTLDIISKYCKEKEKESLYKMDKGTQKYTNRLNTSLNLTIERKKKEKEYWDKLSHIISEDMIELWKTFLIFIQKYFDILKDRANVIDSIYKEEKNAKENMKIINHLKGLEKK